MTFICHTSACIYVISFHTLVSLLVTYLFSKIIGWEGPFNQLNSPSTSYAALCYRNVLFAPFYLLVWCSMLAGQSIDRQQGEGWVDVRSMMAVIDVKLNYSLPE